MDNIDRHGRIWWLALGYFSAYVPYTALTKAISSGAIGDGSLHGAMLLPVSVAASVLGMYVFITLMRWWKFANKAHFLGRDIPFPRRAVAFSGLATAAVVVTTTLAYTFDGVSIVFAMLLMRGGLLIMAPLVDATSGRKVRWNAWVALGLAMTALVVAFLEDLVAGKGVSISPPLAVTITAYLAAYFVRLRLMSGMAKSNERSKNIGFFVEEQMVATPVLLLTLAIVAFTGVAGNFSADLQVGFTELVTSGVFVLVLLIGFFSQGTGIFGGLILLEPQENAFTVPVNRASSILAGIVATYVLHWTVGRAAPSAYQLAGAGIILLAIVVLSVPALLKIRNQKRATG